MGRVQVAGHKVRRLTVATARVLALLVFSTGSFANTIYCGGTVSAVYVDSAGAVIFNGSHRNDYTQVCNLHGSWQGISSETCFSWYSALLAAKVHAKQVLLQYWAPSHTCATLPTYAGALPPAYVMVNN